AGDAAVGEVVAAGRRGGAAGAALAVGAEAGADGEPGGAGYRGRRQPRGDPVAAGAAGSEALTEAAGQGVAGSQDAAAGDEHGDDDDVDEREPLDEADVVGGVEQGADGEEEQRQHEAHADHGEHDADQGGDPPPGQLAAGAGEHGGQAGEGGDGEQHDGDDLGDDHGEGDEGHEHDHDQGGGEGEDGAEQAGAVGVVVEVGLGLAAGRGHDEPGFVIGAVGSGGQDLVAGGCAGGRQRPAPVEVVVGLL